MKNKFFLHKNIHWLEHVARTRSQLYEITRNFFNSRGFIEVETPIIVNYPGNDLFTDVYELIDNNGFLISSPEFSMKKLLGAGFKKIYTITKSFRLNELTRFHNPEFSMLEWYEPYTDYKDLFRLTREYLETVFESFFPDGIIRKGNKKVVFANFLETTLDDLFIEHAGFSFKENSEFKAIKDFASNNLHIDCTKLENWNEVFSMIFIEKIEPFLKKLEFPIAVYDYPVSLASLSKLSADRDVCERFEIYLSGVELCNGFTELDDGEEQKKRFQENHQKIDEDLINALNSEFPPCSGIAVGLDRVLFFCLSEAESLSDVLLFPKV